MQFTWVEQKGVPKIRVIFISNAIQYDERDGIYPVHYDENYRKFWSLQERPDQSGFM